MPENGLEVDFKWLHSPRGQISTSVAELTGIVADKTIRSVIITG